MSTDILTGDIRVHYLGENRQKRLEWVGAATGTRTVNALYSATEDLMDEPLQSDDGSVMSAETPVEYTLGIIDAGDLDPWYMSYDMAEHLTGGAIRTASWTRAVGTNTGIVVCAVTSNTIVAASEGLTITHADGDTGTLLEVIEAGATDYLVIRPATSAAGDNFDSAAGVLTCNATTATQAGASLTGEQIWANLYNVTAVDADTHVYMYQGTVADAARARIARIDASGGDWWDEGAFDRLIYIRDFQTAGNPTIDDGFITVFARKANTLFASFEVGVSTVSGGRNPIPLSASADGNHTTGWKSITTTAVGTDDFTVGDEIEDSVSGARGILTLIAGADPTYTLHYYLIGDPQVVFDTTASTITNNDATGSATKDANPPAAQGPALAAWFTSGVVPTIVHANTTFDIDDNGTAEGWGIEIDCNANPLTEVYEWLSYITQNGQTGTGNSDGIEGEQYVGAQVYLEYSGVVTGTISEGSDVSQATSLATGIVVSHDTTLKQIVLRDTRGTFSTTGLVTDNDAGGTVTPDTAADNFAPFTDAPFGRLAGGRFFGARAVLLSDYLAADENNFQLIDSQGIERVRPIAITLTVSNLDGGAESVGTNDLVSLLRLTAAGGVVDKTEYSAVGGEVLGDATLAVDGSIATDVPGKTSGGVLSLRDADDNNQDYRLRYDSWSGSTFTLSNIVIAAADAGTNTTTITEAGAFTNAKRGDFVYNVTRSLWAYVLTVDDANNVTLDREIAAQTTGDNIELNCIPITVDTLDDVYVHLMNLYATATSESVSIVYQATIDYRAKVTNKRNATKIKPFVTADATSGTNRSIAVIRNTDTIAT